MTVFGEAGRAGGSGRFRLGAGVRPQGAGGPVVGVYGERLDDPARPGGSDDSVVLKGAIAF